MTQWCGAGGYGDPFERDPEKVLWDVIEEKVTPAHAREAYGVVIDVEGRRVDAGAIGEAPPGGAARPGSWRALSSGFAVTCSSRIAVMSRMDQ